MLQATNRWMFKNGRKSVQFSQTSTIYTIPNREQIAEFMRDMHWTQNDMFQFQTDANIEIRRKTIELIMSTPDTLRLTREELFHFARYLLYQCDDENVMMM